MGLPDRPLKFDATFEAVDMGDCPAGLLLTDLQKCHTSGLGDSHIGHAIPDIDGIDMKGWDLDGTGLVLDRWFALDDFECPDVLEDGIQQ